METKKRSLLSQQIDALLYEETDQTANLANASALLFQSLTDVNWVGFYLKAANSNELVLGPFQGNVACMHIQENTGVCGTAFAKQTSLLVNNVHEFPGHIACDSASNSELVIPLIKDGHKLGVLDIDSPIINHFTPDDQQLMEEFVQVLLTHLDIH